MDKLSLYYASFILAGAFLSAVAQVVLKKTAMQSKESINSVVKQYFSWRIGMAYFVLLLAALMGVYALQGIPLSWSPILSSSIYVYIAVFSRVIFGEKLSVLKLISLALIISGICVYGCLG